MLSWTGVQRFAARGREKGEIQDGNCCLSRAGISRYMSDPDKETTKATPFALDRVIWPDLYVIRGLEGDTDSGSCSSSSDDEDQNDPKIWDDWVSDPQENRESYSLFEDKKLASAAKAIEYDEQTHGFNLDRVSSKLALDFHQRVRLVNYIRKQKPSAADLSSLTGAEPFFTNDQYLIPAIEDDPLLQSQSGDWSDEEGVGTSSGVAPKDLESAFHRIRVLEASLKKAKQDLSDYREFVTSSLDVKKLTEEVASTSTEDHLVPKRDDDFHYFTSYGSNEIHATMLADKVRTSTYASFILGTPTVFNEAVVLDVGCGTGILSMFAARSGAKRVYAVDASDIVKRAEKIIKDSGYDDVITVIQGKVEDITFPDGVTEVDVIVSEWMGYALLYESMLDSVLVARDRFLRPGGVFAPSQCRMMLSLCEGTEIYRDRVGMWDDVYGFDMSAMKEEVYGEAIIDIVKPETLVSDPVIIKDIYIPDAQPRQLNFRSSFSLVCTSTKRTKIHAFVLYFDTFFSQLGVPISPSTKVQVAHEGSPIVAEVWPLGGKFQPRRRASQGWNKTPGEERVTSFSTGPEIEPTHWKQTIFLLHEPIRAREGTIVIGTFSCRKSDENSRELDIEIRYSVKGDDVNPPGDLIIQMYKVR
ncbi:protein arginine N-methyltransferase [Thelephora ganbajun]|uniref:Protein arginine N-methyltransferase n=1 Tax=Thelephora ganbajun TaxID=370292 RepID=A0ACB6ZBE8_THEGA|nr:protein arginine N-methyltransferase [Thelephora ganbajun]